MEKIFDGKQLVEIFKTAPLKRNKTSVVLVNNTAKSQIFTVPNGKRWLILRARIENADDVQRTCKIEVRDSADTIFDFIMVDTAMGAGTIFYLPRNIPNDLAEANPSLYPLILDAGENVQFYWAAGGASTGGTAIIFLSVLEIDAEKVI